MGSRLSVEKRRRREADAEYVNGYCMRHKVEVATVVDAYPRDGRFMERMNDLRAKILATRGTEAE